MLTSCSRCIVQKARDEYVQRNTKRAVDMATRFTPLHPELYELRDEHMDPDFLQAFREGRVLIVSVCTLIGLLGPAAVLKLLKKETETGVFSFTMFSKEFCKVVHVA